MIRYLLWDHDGVLVDTERWYFEATRSVLASLGIELDAPTYLDFMSEGRSCWDLAREAGRGASLIETVRSERDALYQRHLRSQPIEIAGAEAVLAALSKRLRMAIVTSARGEDFELIHRERNLVGHVEFALVREDYRECKPHPEPYQKALERFGAQPDEAIAIEDSSRGLRAALAAGVECWIVKNAFTATQDFSGAKRVLASIQEVPAAIDAVTS